MTKRTRGSVRDARRAVADFVDSNLPRFNGWLEQVASGIPQVNRDGESIRNDVGSVVYLVKPDPLAAIKVVADITEYHLPKLSRQDVQMTGAIATLDMGNISQDEITQMSLADLKRLALELMVKQGDVIDVQAEVVEVLPNWLKP